MPPLRIERKLPAFQAGTQTTKLQRPRSPPVERILGAGNVTRTRFFGLADRGTAHIPCPQNLERTVRIELTSSAWKAEAPTTRPRPLVIGAAVPSAAAARIFGCGGENLTRVCGL